MFGFLKKRKKTVVLALLFCFVPIRSFSEEFRRAVTFEDAHAASCRVNASGARGTGTFIGSVGESAYILTNYHVVTTSSKVSVDFWTNSERETLEGKVVWRYYDADLPADFAIIELNAKSLKNSINPPFVALGGKDAKPSINGFIVSSGAPDGRFTQAWKGKVLDYFNGSTVLFSPPPVPGQSGSGILEYKGDELFLTGVLTWLIGEKGRDESKGGAIPVSNIYIAAKRGKLAPTALDKLASPIPPGATECKEASRKTFFFKSTGCNACKNAAPDVAKLKEDGENIVEVETSTSSGLEFAKSEGVKLIPCAIVYEGGEKTTIEADTIVYNGLYKTFRERFPAKAREYGAASSAEAEDFRARPPVRDEATIKGLLEDSESRWGARPRTEPPETSPSEPPGGTTDAETANRLGDRIAERLAEAMGSKIESEAQKLGGVLEKKLDGYASKIEEDVKGAISGKANEINEGIRDAILRMIEEKIKAVWRFVRNLFFGAAVVLIASALWKKKKGSTDEPKRTDDAKL